MANRPICSEDTPDPWMIQRPPEIGLFYLTFTCRDRVEIWSSQSLENFEGCKKSCVWRPKPGSPWSADIWAPELHNLNGTWYIYVSGAQPQEGNRSHRTLILRSTNPVPTDPHSWQFLGPLHGMPDQWAIDATVFTLNNAFPVEADPNTLVCISKPTLAWERVENRGINEGPQFISIPEFTGIVYSASGSWSNKYKLGALQLVEHDVMSSRSWRKLERPVMMSDPDGRQGPHGPGHASFIYTTDPSRVCSIYHATGSPTDGWANRKAHVCLLGPETLIRNQTVICGVPTPQGQGQMGYPCGPQANMQTQGSAIQGHGLMENPGGTEAQALTHGHRSFFDKMNDKMKDKLREW